MKRPTAKEAQESLRERIRHEPENALLWASLGEALALQYTHDCIHRDLQGRDVGDPEPYFEEAVACYQKVIELARDDPRGYLGLGHCFCGHTMPVEALEMFLAALNCDPTMVRPRLTVCQLFMEAKRYDEAVEHAEIVLADEPENAEAILVRAHIYRLTGEYEPAREWYQRHLQFMPTSRPGLLGLGLVYGQLGMLELGEAHIWESIEIHDGYEANYALSKLYEMAGRTEDAEAMHKKALTQYREFWGK